MDETETEYSNLGIYHDHIGFFSIQQILLFFIVLDRLIVYDDRESYSNLVLRIPPDQAM